ncbi:unnamed protein product [Rhizoctonia solani]|uniref:Jacalin-type lectin domain-containing protein n=3 Tax=Rhizoctonia solani TaxID=456999 RepID=A0A8H3A6J4_9AGAM|nr:transmembrane protein, putative [Rhizoctonia solani AG-3 Rhs1AP]KEP47139.1 putative transmembrane protein [Rhizoctonia solani 123E]CAE6409412.1 unnamed protein product [Rhizoctonia solani]CAE6475683.1 unnamed protein product [Rhizoctonia solani]
MSKLSGLPDLPASVGGQSIPDFMNFEIVGDGKLPARHEVPPEFDFSIKKSPIFGLESGKQFDEGAVWHPLREVKFALSDAGLGHYQGHYPGRSTAPVGQLSSTKTIGLKLNKGEHIVGFRVCSNNNAIEGVRVWTNDGSHKDFGKVQGATERGKDPEAFFVPADHEVVNFFGHTNDDGHIHGLGASYTRRLASLVAKAPTSLSSAPSPTLNAFMSQTYLDASTQTSWANNDVPAVVRKRDQASKDLAPLYDNINKNGDSAWTLVRDPETQQEYYTCYNDNAIVWSYVTDKPSTSGSDDIKNSIISIGSYSKSQNMLGLSGYIWDSIPATTAAAIIGLAVTFLIQPLITEGITWGIAFAATQLVEYLAIAGAPSLAALVPASVATGGGLIIAGIIGIFVAFGVLALFSFIWKKFWLVMNVYNFDSTYEWRSVNHYDDNANISNGEWKTKSIDTFKPADSVVFPPGFKPQKPLESVVTYLAMTWENDSTFMQGLGEGVVMGRQDNQAGVALKYIVHYWTDNEIGLNYIDGNPTSYNLSNYYNNGSWLKALSTQASSQGYTITGHTPKLGGSSDNDYYYDVSIGLPPHVTR